MKDQEKQIIGSTEYVVINDAYVEIPAKIDTGADSSSIWASDILMSEEGVLSFCFFGKKSPYYTGKRESTTEYKAAIVRSSNGEEEIRYRVKLKLGIGGKTVIASFTLADRSRNHFPVLIGRRTISGKFLVDVSQTTAPRKKPTNVTALTQQLQENPYKFHQKYQSGKEK